MLFRVRSDNEGVARNLEKLVQTRVSFGKKNNKKIIQAANTIRCSEYSVQGLFNPQDPINQQLRSIRLNKKEMDYIRLAVNGEDLEVYFSNEQLYGIPRSKESLRRFEYMDHIDKISADSDVCNY